MEEDAESADAAWAGEEAAEKGEDNRGKIKKRMKFMSKVNLRKK